MQTGQEVDWSKFDRYGWS